MEWLIFVLLMTFKMFTLIILILGMAVGIRIFGNIFCLDGSPYVHQQIPIFRNLCCNVYPDTQHFCQIFLCFLLICRCICTSIFCCTSKPGIFIFSFCINLCYSGVFPLVLIYVNYV